MTKFIEFSGYNFFVNCQGETEYFPGIIQQKTLKELRMEIINKTCVPTKILESLIEEGLKVAKCKHTNFKIQFNPGKYLRGVAYRLNTSCKVVIPMSRNGISYIWRDDENLGRLIYQVIVHEFQHVADYQNGVHMGTYYQRKGTKPCEVRAIAAEELAIENMPLGLLDNLENFLNIKRNFVEEEVNE